MYDAEKTPQKVWRTLQMDSQTPHPCHLLRHLETVPERKMRRLDYPPEIHLPDHQRKKERPGKTEWVKLRELLQKSLCMV
jgi:hypothetical protein